MRRTDGISLREAFVELPSSTTVYYLDTCVWSALVKSDLTQTSFRSYFQLNDYVAALSSYTLFELSRAPRLFDDYDALFFDMKHSVWIPSLYDQTLECELENYPNKWRMRWLPVSTLSPTLS